MFAKPPLPDTFVVDGVPKVDCKWGDWANWTQCSKTCDGGTRWRVRARSTVEESGGAPCVGSTHEVEDCNVGGCKTDCTWASWTPWMPCSHTCGGGVMLRTRTIEIPMAWGGQKCKGDEIQEEACSMQPCPLDCKWHKWSAWGKCSQSCGGGFQARDRSAEIQAAFGGSPCDGDSTESRNCNAVDCPVNCTWGQWGGWSACDKTCGGGKAARGRNKDTIEANGGEQCAGLPQDVVTCNEEECPIDCEWGSWKTWSSCDKTCGGGKKSRTRRKHRLAVGAGVDCQGPNTAADDCGTQACPHPINCRWEDWSLWSVCSVTCGTGARIRTRAKEVKSPDGKPCKGLGMQTGECDNEAGCSAEGVTLPPRPTSLDGITGPVDGPGHGTRSTTAAPAITTVLKGSISFRVSHPKDFVHDDKCRDAMHEGIAVLTYSTWKNTQVSLVLGGGSATSPSALASGAVSFAALEGQELVSPAHATASIAKTKELASPGAHQRQLHPQNHTGANAEADLHESAAATKALHPVGNWMARAEGRATLRFTVLHARDDTADELASYSPEDITSVLASALARHALLYNLEVDDGCKVESVKQQTEKSVKKQTEESQQKSTAEADTQEAPTTASTTTASTTIVSEEQDEEQDVARVKQSNTAGTTTISKEQDVARVRQSSNTAATTTISKDGDAARASVRPRAVATAVGLQAALLLFMASALGGISRS